MMMLDSNFFPVGEPDSGEVCDVSDAMQGLHVKTTDHGVVAIKERHNVCHKYHEVEMKEGDLVLIGVDKMNRAI